MMKIAQVNCVYKFGSTGKIVYDLHASYLEKGHESYVFYGRGVVNKEKNVFKISTEFEAKVHGFLSKMFGVDFGHSFFATKRLIKAIRKIKPDVVHLHCLNGHFVNVYKIIEFLKKNEIKTILTLHAELMHTAGCEHAMECEKWRTGCYNCKYIRGSISHIFRDDAKHCYSLIKKACSNFPNLTVVGCSNWIMERAKASSVFAESRCDFSYVHNDINTLIFRYIANTNIRDRLGIPNDKKMILNVTSRFSYFIKGPTYLIELAKRLPDYMFVVVGFDYWKDTLPKNVITVKCASSQKELAEYYSAADCFISTSIRETLPTVCLEASACDCNVLAFDSGGAKETIKPNQGDVVTPYDIDEYVEKIEYWASQEKKHSRIGLKNNMSEKYLELYGSQNEKNN